ncbi:MAG: c-type cytochrome [Thermoanaerobaculia bacterium]|nr:c-type cytochrome [Thermoanaerobaculia bacterium]
MEKRTDSPYPRKDLPILAIIGVLLVISTIVFAVTDHRKDWRYYQAEFKKMVAEKFGAEKAATIPSGMKQIWVPDMRRADRCITCHQGILWKGFETADHPYKTHPPEPIRTHPIEKYGCTSCHGGQGFAVQSQEAHGPVKFWEEPVLGKSMGEGYSLAGDDKGALIQMNCNVCHRFDRETKGMDMINHAKKLVRDKGCRACHVVNSRGGTIGPDLTFVGDKAAEQYDMSRLGGQKTAFAWHVSHFKNPKEVVPDTVMPNFGFGTKDAQSLAALMLSWKRAPVPVDFRPGVARTDPQTAEEVADEQRMKTGPGAWFVKTGCFICHSVSSLGVKSAAQIGPDLSTAVEDTQSRFGKTVDDFVKNPTCTMSVVLTRQIVLTDQEKEVAIQKLREAYAEHQKQKAAGTAATASGGH